MFPTGSIREGVRFYVLVYPEGAVKMFDLMKDEEIEKIDLQTPCGTIALTKAEIKEEI